MFLLAITASTALVASAQSLSPFPFQIVDIEPLFNNIAASSDGSADFNGIGSSFDSQFLPTGEWAYDNINYELPPSWGSSPDNVIAQSQVITLEKATYVHELHILYSGDGRNGTDEFVANFVANFADNSSLDIALYARNWWRWPILNVGVINTPYHFENQGLIKNFNTSDIFQWSTSLSSEQPLTSITLPPLSSSRVHLFAISMSPSTISSTLNSPALSIRRVQFSQRWELVDGVRLQAVSVTLSNLLPSFMLANATSIDSKHTVEVVGNGTETVAEGTFYRLVPGDQVRLDVLVKGAVSGNSVSVIIKDSSGNVRGLSENWEASSLIEEWTPQESVLSLHETPTWWNNAKFGIFIHWGVYSVPAWAPPEEYAEWYDWYQHVPANSSSPTWVHHKDTYGEAVVYDDFIGNFTGSRFNASDWVDFFDAVGAKYFVLVAKHHDGFALFDTGNTSHRSSVYLGPKRDFVKELLDTAKAEKPDLHRGTYYSLPEWYNPDSARYGFGQWPGGLAHNAYNASELEPYSGHLKIADYLDDLQLPQMLDLGIKYDSEIMWCDIGGPNKTLEFAAQYYNYAMSQGRQVTINNRCSQVPDFVTPEYATFGSIQTVRWESSEGMDPFSYGLNTATNASEYKNATTILQTLIDIASKNGNYLLDIGPTAEGEIIAPMKDNLLEAGAWLKYSGQCIYDTEYWFQGSQDINAVVPARFLTAPTTFCIVSFDKPIKNTLIVNKRLPLLTGDTIRLLTPEGAGTVLPWSMDFVSGALTINISNAEVDLVDNAWAFQVEFNVD